VVEDLGHDSILGHSFRSTCYSVALLHPQEWQLQEAIQNAHMYNADWKKKREKKISFNSVIVLRPIYFTIFV